MNNLIDKIKELFDSKNVCVTAFQVGYDNTNFVFDVISDIGCCIVKVPKVLDDPNNTFWKGLNFTFDLTSEISIKHQEAISVYINKEGTIKVPKILKVDFTSNNVLEKPFVILEKMLGDPIPQGSDLERRVMQEDDHFAVQLGQHMGALHLKTMNYFGPFN